MADNSCTASGSGMGDVSPGSILRSMRKLRPVDLSTYLVNPLMADKVPEGLPVTASPHVPLHGQKWEFPSDPFVDYEEGDEAWARPIGYGRLVEDRDNFVVYRMYRPRPFAIAIPDDHDDDAVLVDLNESMRRSILERLSRSLGCQCDARKNVILLA